MLLAPRLMTLARHLACAGIALLLAGAAVPSAAQQTAPLTHLRIGTPGGDSQAESWYAEDEGFFKHYGLDADVQAMRGSGAGITAAIVGGAIDIGEADLIAIAAARQHGIPLVILAPSGMYNESAPTTAMIGAKSGGPHDGKALDGTTVAVLSLEGPAKVATMAWIDKTGGRSDSVHYVEMSPTQMGDAVEHGTVAAATPTEPSLSVALEKTSLVAPIYSAIGPRFQISAWFATEDWIKKNPAAARAFVSAIHDTAVWANNPANHPRSAEILSKYTKIPLARLSKMNRATYGLTYDPALGQPLLDAAYKYHSIAKPESAKELTQAATARS
jgi:ABC-type nitrate/sulfonate/bicarbonate transport system substrate-binding protein